MTDQQKQSAGMAGQKPLWALRPIDWAWVGMGYCFFVVFHLLPSYFMTGPFEISMNRGAELAPALWLFFGLAIVAFSIGYRSRGVTILEPGLSGLLYALTIFLFMARFTGRGVTMRTIGYAYVMIVALFVTAVVCAWLGEVVQQRRGKKSGT